MSVAIDLAPLQAWIGKTETVQDFLTQSLIDRFRATLEPHLWSGTAPLGLHWCLALGAIPIGELSSDGHAKKGGFLPPVPLPSRMWAGGEVVYHHDLIPNASVTRISTVSDIVAKQGKSGTLVFVTVHSEFYSDGLLCISDRQDLVFRDHSVPGKPVARKLVPPPINATRTKRDTITPDPVLLFRYSALTFNSHRIHYDADYAKNTEGYADLVVHGPLQATLLLNAAAKISGKSPYRFSYRGVAPITVGSAIEIHHTKEDNTNTIWCQASDGTRSFTATFSDA